MNFKIFNKYKGSYYKDKEKQLTPFFCYKCLCFHFYSMIIENDKAQLIIDCPHFKNPISLITFLDYGLSLFSNLIQCMHCNLKFLSSPKTNFNYCSKCKSYICNYCLNNNSPKKQHVLIPLKDIGIFCLEHNSKFKYSCSKCTKSICEVCKEKEHKNHNFIFELEPLNKEDFECMNKGYIKKPRDANKTYQDLKVAKKFINEVSDKNKISSFKAKINEIQKEFSTFETTNYLLYLIVLKLFIKFFKNLQNENDVIFPFELENNLKNFSEYSDSCCFNNKYTDEIYQTIESIRELTEKEKEYKNYDKGIIQSYCLYPFLADPYINIENYTKSVRELELEHYGFVGGYNIKLLPQNKLVFIYLIVSWEDSEGYGSFTDKIKYYYLIDPQSLENKLEKEHGLEDIIDICEYKKNIFIGISDSGIYVFGFQNYKFNIINEMEQSFGFFFDTVNSLPNNKILVSSGSVVLVLSMKDNNQLFFEKKYCFKNCQIDDILIFPNLEEFIFIDKRRYAKEVDTIEKSYKYVDTNFCKLVFMNYNFQDKCVMNFQKKIISLIQLDKELICALSVHEIFIININNKKILINQKYDYTFNEVFKYDGTKFICNCKDDEESEDIINEFILIFEYNKNHNTISFFILLTNYDRFSHPELIYIFEKQKAFFYVVGGDEKIKFIKLLNK